MHNEHALLSFADSKFVYGYYLDVAILVPTSHNDRLPSLLGRDILSQWRFVLEPTKGIVTFTRRKWTMRDAV